MKFKLLALILSAALVLLLSGCDKGSSSEPTSDGDPAQSACASFCEVQIECDWTGDDQDTCTGTCMDDVAEVAEANGDECADLEVQINACLGGLSCSELETMEKCESLLNQFDEACG